jgi:hypothetical protein
VSGRSGCRLRRDDRVPHRQRHRAGRRHPRRPTDRRGDPAHLQQNQRSQSSDHQVVQRRMATVWFLDSDRRPDWFHEVPTIASNPLPWISLPDRRAATATGLSTFVAERCRPGAFEICPGGQRRPCGGWHPRREPWGGLTVDDVAELVPATQIVPIRDTAGAVHLTSPRSARLYRELSGYDCEYAPTRRGPTSRLHGQPRACVNPHRRHHRATCSCGSPIYPLTQLIRVAEVCERCRIDLGLPRPHLPDAPRL